jgi:hypothetical protein
MDQRETLNTEIRDPRGDYNDDLARLWVTEVGVSTDPDAAPENRVSLENQGPTLSALYDEVGSDVRSFLIFRYREVVPDPMVRERNRFDHMGVVWPGLSPKPAHRHVGCWLGGRNCQN